MTTRSIIVCIALFTFELVPSTASAQSRSEKAIQEAITLLEARQAAADQVTEKEEIGRAIETLKATLPKAAPPKPDGQMPEFTTADFRKKLKGRVTYDEKAGELTLVYDFRRDDQLDDFNVKADQKSVVRGAVILQGGERATHIVKFESLTVTGVIQFNNISGKHVTTTGNYGIGTTEVGGSYTRLFVYAGNDRAETALWNRRDLCNKPLPFQLLISEERVSSQVGTKIKLGTGIKDKTIGNAGQLVLQGVNGPSAFGNLTLSGKVDLEWAKQFLAP